MKPNQNFGEKFTDNMAESVKLADYMANESEANIHNTFMKFAGGGRNNQFDVSEDKGEIKYEVIPDIKPIRTDHSQVSGIGGFDNAFTKKGNNNQMLTDLRREYERIKDIRAPERKVEEKLSNSNSASSSSSRSNVNDPSSSSMERSKVNKKDSNLREERLWQVERKQFEYMIANCQHKIEQLLHSEMQYKKMIHDLRSTNLLYKPNSSTDRKSEDDIKDLQRQLRQEKERNQKLIAELERVKVTSKQQTQRLSKLESESNQRSKDESKWNEERRRLDENLRLEKDRYMNNEIDKRKYQMENELLLKEKDQEATRVQKQIQHLNAMHELNLQNIIKKYKDEIEIKDKRYMLLVSEYEKLKKQYAATVTVTENTSAKDTSNSNTTGFMEILKKLIEDRRQANPHEELTKTMREILDKLTTQPQSPEKPRSPPSVESDDEDDKHNETTERLMSEIRTLKAEIEALRSNDNEIDFEPMKRMYESEIGALKDTISMLERKLKNTNKEDTVPIIQKDDITLNLKIKEIQRLQQRIRQLEHHTSSHLAPSFPISETEEDEEKRRALLDDIENELRNERRLRNQLEFEVTKLQKQLEFKIHIMNNETESKLKNKQQQIDRANGNIDQWKREFENMKKFYEHKLEEKNRLLETQISTSKAPIEQIRRHYEESIQKNKMNYQLQVKSLTDKYSSFSKQSYDYDALLKKYTVLEAEYFELQSQIVKAKQINESVDHLWQIKETQYQNVDAILKNFKTFNNQVAVNEVLDYSFNAAINQQQINNIYPQPQTNIIRQPINVIPQPQPQSQLIQHQPQIIQTLPHIIQSTAQPQVQPQIIQALPQIIQNSMIPSQPQPQIQPQVIQTQPQAQIIQAQSRPQIIQTQGQSQPSAQPNQTQVQTQMIQPPQFSLQQANFQSQLMAPSQYNFAGFNSSNLFSQAYNAMNTTNVLSTDRTQTQFLLQAMNGQTGNVQNIPSSINMVADKTMRSNSQAYLSTQTDPRSSLNPAMAGSPALDQNYSYRNTQIEAL